MRKRPKLGDLLEIPVKSGFAYALFTHKAESHGDLIRVWTRTCSEPANDFEDLLREPPSFSCFVALSHSVSKGLIRIVNNVHIPAELASFPVFRTGLVGKEGRVSTWWLWDGVNEWKVGDLTEESKTFPARGTWTYGMLKLRIENNWNTRQSDF